MIIEGAQKVPYVKLPRRNLFLPLFRFLPQKNVLQSEMKICLWKILPTHNGLR